MALFGPPDVKKLEKRKDIKGLLKALNYKREGKNKYRTHGEEADVRRNAASALTRIGTPETVPVLLEAAREDHVEYVRIYSLQAVEKLIPALDDSAKKDVQETLIFLLEKAPIKVAKACVEPLASLNGKESVLALAHFYYRNRVPTSDQKSILSVLNNIPNGKELLINAMLERLDKSCARILEKMDWKPDESRAGLVYWLVKRKSHSPDANRSTRFILNALDTQEKEKAIDLLKEEIVDKDDPAVNTVLELLGWQPGKGAADVAYLISKEDYDACAAIGAAAVPALAEASPAHLEKIIDPQAIEPLITLVQKERPKQKGYRSQDKWKHQAAVRKILEVKQSAKKALINFGDLAVDALMKSLNGLSPTDSDILELLGEIRSDHAWETIWKFTEDNRLEVRSEAFIALSKLEIPADRLDTITLELVKKLRNPTRAYVGKNELNTANNYILAMVAKTGEPGINAIKEMVRIPKPYLINELGQTLKDMFAKIPIEKVQEELLSEHTVIRRAAFDTLHSQLETSVWMDMLVPMLDEKDKQIRVEVLSEIGKLEDERKTDIMLSMLNDPYGKIICTAVHNLENVTTEPVFLSLLPLLEHPDEPVRICALQAVGRFAKEKAAQYVVPFLEDESRLIRQTAANSLDKMRWTYPNDRQQAAYKIASTGGVKVILKVFHQFDYTEIEPLLEKSLEWEQNWVDRANLVVEMIGRGRDRHNPCFHKTIQDLLRWENKQDEEELVLGDQDYFKQVTSFRRERALALDLLKKIGIR